VDWIEDLTRNLAAQNTWATSWNYWARGTTTTVPRLTVSKMRRAASRRVPDPGRYGVAELDGYRILSIEEKPERPKSDYAVAGIYVYPPDVFDVIGQLRPSGRGEFEITDVNRYYLQLGRLGYSVLSGYWTDAGTPESLALANRLVYQVPPGF